MPSFEVDSVVKLGYIVLYQELKKRSLEQQLYSILVVTAKDFSGSKATSSIKTYKLLPNTVHDCCLRCGGDSVRT